MDTAMVARSAALFVAAGLCEIAGGYLVWLWLRDHRTAWLGALGGLILFLYGGLPTLQPETASFGRVYAAYGGVFVAMSLAWGGGSMACDPIATTSSAARSLSPGSRSSCTRPGHESSGSSLRASRHCAQYPNSTR